MKHNSLSPEKIQLFVLITCILVFTQNSIAQNYYDDTEMEELTLKGKVKSIVKTSYYAKQENGNITKTTPVNTSDVSMTHGYYSVFNEKGMIEIRRTLTSFDSISYKYNTRGLIEKEIHKEHEIQYKYTDNGLLDKVIKKRKGQQYIQTKSYYYNSKKQLTHTIEYDFDSNPIQKNDYNSKGKLIQSSQNTSMSDTVEWQKIKTFKYDNKNRRIKEVNTYDNLPGIWKQAIYDKNGNRIKYTFLNQLNPQPSYSYSYQMDKKGNWTQRIIKDNEGNPFFLTERVIEYY